MTTAGRDFLFGTTVLRRAKIVATAGYDRSHNFHLGYVYEFPAGKGKKYLNSGIGAAVLGGWQANGIVAIYSGAPFIVTADGTALNAPGNTQTADLVGAVQKTGACGSILQHIRFCPGQRAQVPAPSVGIPSAVPE